VKEISVEHGEAPPDLPCVVLDVDDKRAKRLNIKLNSLTGEFEARMLGELLIDIYEEPDVPEEEAFDLGFTREEAMDYVHLIEPPPETGGDDKAGGTEFARSVTLSIEFSTVDARNRVKKLLAERSTIEKKKPGDIVAAFFAPRARKPKAKRPSKKRAA
jgi:ParB-like chromosome segregation protein Spo0J